MSKPSEGFTMTAQSCRTCDYFSLEDKPRGDGAGDCCWVTRHPIPDCVPKWEHDTEADAGKDCPCWRAKGHIEAFLADAKARRKQEQSQ